MLDALKSIALPHNVATSSPIAVPTILLAGSASGVGKTLTALALLATLRDQGYNALAAKAGSDFIDPSYLAAITNQPCANLDPWMQGVDGVRALFDQIADKKPDILLLEGTMGLFDGGLASTAALCTLFRLPVLLLLSAKGMGESIAAQALGYVLFAQNAHIPIKGLLTSFVGGSSHAHLLEKALRPVCEQFALPYLGGLPQTGAPTLSSRHLGLVSPREAQIAEKRAALISWFSSAIDTKRLLQTLALPPTKTPIPPSPLPFFLPPCPKKKHTVVIAIAYDEAFPFLYADLPSLLIALGCRITFFSPLTQELPPCHGVFLPGGYPERFAKTLSKNTALQQSLACAKAKDVPIYAECGGFMLLLEGLYTKENTYYPMMGLLPGCVRMEEKRQALGYRTAIIADWPYVGTSHIVRGHEFHYGRLLPTQTKTKPFATLFAKDGHPMGSSGIIDRSLAASWLHIAPEGGRSFFRAWVSLIKEHA
ncbi:MAG: cobyrinate a,c-diamide synthase [Desulfovibrio sp.]|nr:cobyrinate a,c-diamide synthase [Desulfovibrio sp.]